MEQDLKTPLLDNIFSALKRIQKIVKRSQRWDQILFWIIAANALYLSWSFIYHTSITSYMNRSEFIEMYKLPLIAEAFSVLVGILLIPIKKRNQKKLRSLPVTAIREIFERGEVPSLIIPLSEEKDPYLELIQTIFPNIKDHTLKVFDREVLNILIRISSLIDWDQDLGTLREILVSEIESLSEQERREYLRDFSELEKFFSEL